MTPVTKIHTYAPWSREKYKVAAYFYTNLVCTTRHQHCVLPYLYFALVRPVSEFLLRIGEYGTGTHNELRLPRS